MARDYKAEYARRIALGGQRGLSRSQARGHPRTGELGARTVRRIAGGDLRINLMPVPGTDQTIVTTLGREPRMFVVNRAGIDSLTGQLDKAGVSVHDVIGSPKGRTGAGALLVAYASDGRSTVGEIDGPIGEQLVLTLTAEEARRVRSVELGVEPPEDEEDREALEESEWSATLDVYSARGEIASDGGVVSLYESLSIDLGAAEGRRVRRVVGLVMEE